MLFQVSWPSAPGGHEHRFTEHDHDEIRCEARTKRSPRTRSCVTSIRDAVSGRNKPKTAPWVECPRPPVGSSDRKHSFIS